MEFRADLTSEQKEYLEEEYKEYIKKNKFTAEEKAAIREWVKDGNSVYDNQIMITEEDGYPVEFIEVWRDLEYINKATKGMPPDEYRSFALEYFGMNTDFLND